MRTLSNTAVMENISIPSEFVARKATVGLRDLAVKIYADGADKAAMLELYTDPLVKGFTTNPTLMRKSGVSDYCAFAREMLQLIPDRPISLEVFADEFVEMEQQALEIASWGENINVKIP